MKILSLSRLIELVPHLPDLREVARAETGYATVIRLPIRDWDPICDAGHPECEFEAHKNTFAEFEALPCQDTRGVLVRRWVLRGLVAI